MSWKKILIGILGVAFVIECLFPIGGFLLPERVLGLFQVQATSDTLFLTFVLAWCLLFIALICGLALYLVRRDDRTGWVLSYVLGYWWIGIGAGLFLVYGRIDNLFLDALKGLIIVIAAHRSHPQTGGR